MAPQTAGSAPPTAMRRPLLSTDHASPTPPLTASFAPGSNQMPSSLGGGGRSSLIQKQVLREGHGRAACPGDLLDVAYVGWLTAVGESAIFDKADEFVFRLGVRLG
jgi:hypothetical protein